MMPVLIPGRIINNRAARSFRYTVLPVGSRSCLRSYSYRAWLIMVVSPNWMISCSLFSKILEVATRVKLLFHYHDEFLMSCFGTCING